MATERDGDTETDVDKERKRDKKQRDIEKQTLTEGKRSRCRETNGARNRKGRVG